MKKNYNAPLSEVSTVFVPFAICSPSNPAGSPTRTLQEVDGEANAVCKRYI